MKTFLSLSLLCISLTVNAQKSVLINNVQIFNGKDEKTSLGNILIEDNFIKTISSSKITVDKTAVIIDGKGKFVMPGLIDAHSHTMMESMPMQMMQVADMGFINLFAAHAAEKQLLRGFTTVRDLGGASLSLKSAIEQQLTLGPKIYASRLILK